VVLALAVVAGTVVLVGGFVLLFVRDVRWWTDEHSIYRRGITGRKRRVGRDQLASVLLATQFTAGRTGPAVLLVLRDRTGRPLLRLSGPIWDTQQVERFVNEARLGPVTRVDVPSDAAYMRRHQPRALGWASEHPVMVVLITVIATLLLVAAIVGAVALTVGLDG
jgi:hypothetical protein